MDFSESAFMEFLTNFAEDHFSKKNFTLPAHVVHINENNTVDVKIPLDYLLFSRETGEEKRVTRPVVRSVQVANCLNVGKFTINFPIEVGNRGIIMAMDRDCSLYFSSEGSVSPPANLTTNNFACAIFVPFDFFNKSVSLKNNKNIIINKDKNPLLEIDLDNSKMSITSAVEITGDVKISGKLSVSGIDFASHVHSYNEPVKDKYPSSTGKPKEI